ncbi:MAG: hypothetical protein AAF513_12495 [Pseudomonadota bacterium]
MQILELNDWQVTLWRDEQPRVEPAAASVVDGKLVFGDAALAHSRTAPQLFNYRYLATIASDPLPTAIGAARNLADLLYHHLRHLELDDQPCLLSVPGHFNNDQLGLLYGICNEASVNVRSFVDLPLAHSLHAPATGEFQVLDIEWHRFALSTISSTSTPDGVRREVIRTQNVEHIGGVANLIEKWMNVIADDFVRKTRFDPLHAGASEQAVFDQVHGWFGGALADQRISIEANNTLREHDIGKNLLTERLAGQLSQLEFDPQLPVLPTARCQQVPGLTEFLSTQSITLLPTDEVDLYRSYQQIVQQLDNDGVVRISSATSPLVAGAKAITPTGPSMTGSRATHLLRADHSALALDDPRVADLPPCDAGEQVTLDGIQYTAIRVIGHGDS